VPSESTQETWFLPVKGIDAAKILHKNLIVVPRYADMKARR
jgi:hypothetical protein